METAFDPWSFVISIVNQLLPSGKSADPKLVENILLVADTFDIIILNGYAKEEADRLTAAITTPDGMKREHIETAFDKLKGIRSLRAYLASVEMNAMHAADTLDDLKFTRNDIKVNPTKYLDTDEG